MTDAVTRKEKVFFINKTNRICPHRLPRQCMDELAVRFGRTATLLAGIRADGDNLCRLPKRLFKAFSG